MVDVRPARIEAADTRLLGPEAQLLHLCGHLLLHHGSGDTLRLLRLHMRECKQCAPL